MHHQVSIIIIIAHRLSSLFLTLVTCQSSIGLSAQDRSTEIRFGRKRLLLPKMNSAILTAILSQVRFALISQFALARSSQFTQFESWRIRVCRRRAQTCSGNSKRLLQCPSPSVLDQSRMTWAIVILRNGSEKGLGRLGTEEVVLVG